MAKIITSLKNDLIEAAAQINRGGLVAFPTETVYGLGAKLDDQSLKQIFEAKRRPFSDPLIVHFSSPEKTKEWIKLSPAESLIFEQLSSRFWPGPLTIVCKSSPKVPPLVMAGTGCVGVRVPNHSIAHQFLEISEIPIAAPSANRFGHISPTTPDHVMNDLGDVEGLLVISGGESTIGIESTVVKLNENIVVILRPGFITQADIESCLGRKIETAKDKNEKLASPGHEDRHYAPGCQTYLIQKDASLEAELLDETVFVDFNRTFWSLSSKFLRYFDLSPIGSVQDSVKSIYSILRDSELTPGVKQILIVDISEHTDESQLQLSLSLRDRLLRSSSHQSRKLSQS